MKKYSLPKLPYAYNALEPHISEKVLRIHHDKHHQGYVNNSNKLLSQLDEARDKGTEVDIKSLLKALSFNVAGQLLHRLFWENMSPDGGDKPSGKLLSKIEQEFGSFKRFKQEFTKAAASVEGSGWALLTHCKGTDRLIIVQVEKHNVNVIPYFDVLLVIDVWEHAYYLDYENNRAKFLDAFWKVVNWDAVAKRLK